MLYLKPKKLKSYFIALFSSFWLFGCGQLEDIFDNASEEDIAALIQDAKAIATEKGWITGDKGNLIASIPEGYSKDDYRLFGLEFLPECSVKQNFHLQPLAL